MKSLLALIAAFTIASLAYGQAPSEDSLYRRLATQGVDSTKALTEVLDKTEATSAVLLYTASGVALREKRLEDAGYLFYVARFRALFDKELFPPTGTGGDSPMVMFGALQQTLGETVNPALMAEPKIFAKVLTKVKSWTPQVASSYQPGWPYAKSGSKSAAEAALKDGKKKFLDGMGGICELLQDEAYFAAFRIGQNYNFKRGADRPSKEAFDAAFATMERIEREKGIQGIASKNKK